MQLKMQERRVQLVRNNTILSGWIKHSSVQVLTTDLSAKRGTSVSGKQYLKIYVYKKHKPVVSSLKTTDKNKAIIATAIVIIWS